MFHCRPFFSRSEVYRGSWRMYVVAWHCTTAGYLLQRMIASCVVVLWPQSLHPSRMKNQRGHWVCWVSTSGKNSFNNPHIHTWYMVVRTRYLIRGWSRCVWNHGHIFAFFFFALRTIYVITPLRFYIKLENVRCEYDWWYGWNSVPQVLWYQ